MKKFTIQENIGKETFTADIFLDNPNPKYHPLHFQEIWLRRNKNFNIPQNILAISKKSFEISKESKTSFLNLFSQGLKLYREGDSLKEVYKKVSKYKGSTTNDKDKRKLNAKTEPINFGFKVRKEEKHLLNDIKLMSEKVVSKKSEIGYAAQDLFFGLCLYLISFPNKDKTLVSIYNIVSNTENFVYNLAITLDTQGKYIHPQGFIYLSEFFEKNPSLHYSTVHLLKEHLESYVPVEEKRDFKVIEEIEEKEQKKEIQDPFERLSYNEDSSLEIEKICKRLLKPESFIDYDAYNLIVGISLGLLSIPTEEVSIVEIRKILASEDPTMKLATFLDENQDEIDKESESKIGFFLRMGETEREEVLLHIVNTFDKSLGIQENEVEFGKEYKSSKHMKAAIYYKQERYKDSIDLYLEIIKDNPNDCDANIEIASMYYYGGGDQIKIDYNKAFRYAQNAYNDGKGDEYSYNWISCLYTDGSGCEKDIDKAVSILRRSIKKYDSSQSKHILGSIYLDDTNQFYNIEEGIKLLKESANDSYSDALYDLGCFYKDGTNLKKDINKAKELLLSASELGHPDAQKALDDMGNSEIQNHYNPSNNFLNYATDNSNREDKTQETEYVSEIEEEFDYRLCDTDIDIENLVERLSTDKAKKAFSLLLYGPPGTGKSRFARYLAKAIGIKVLSYRASDLLSKWHGESEKNIAEAFKKAKKEKAMLIFDEADSLLTERSDEEIKDWRVTEVNEMLTWMESHEYPFICTTNLIKKIDRAALRRFIFKLSFKFLSSERVKYAYEHFFNRIAPEKILNIGCLTPGDFAVIKKRSIILGQEDDDEKICEMIKNEAIRKSPSNVIYLDKKDVDFDFNLANSKTDLKKLTSRLCSEKAQKNFSILLYGSPGTGKSLYIRHLASELEMECIEKRASDIIGSYSGDSEKAIAKTFIEAKERKAFLLFDEIDSLLGDREDADSNKERSMVNELLTWIENHPYPVAATTNFIDYIDEAAKRRFLFKVNLSFLSAEQVKYASEKFLGSKSSDLLDDVSGLTPSFFAGVRKKAEIFGLLSNKEELESLIKEDVEKIKHQNSLEKYIM